MTEIANGAGSSWSPERSAAGGHNPYLIAFVVSIATFMEVLDATIANVALRHIAGGLADGIDESTYVVTSYLVANAIVLSISGWLSTVIGRKRFYMICVATFAFASLLCGFAWSLEALVLFRILQGLGGGGMATSEQAILADSFPPAKRGQAFVLIEQGKLDAAERVLNECLKLDGNDAHARKELEYIAQLRKQAAPVRKK